MILIFLSIMSESGTFGSLRLRDPLYAIEKISDDSVKYFFSQTNYSKI